MISKENLKQTFLQLVKIDSPSKKEADVAAFVKNKLDQLGINYRQDKSGNIIGYLPGKGAPLLIGTHLDTVEPCQHIQPIYKAGVFKSDGTTILGADNKAVVAAILEFLNLLRNSRSAHRPLEIVFTVEEELGSLGASALDFTKLKAREGITFDREGDFGVITSAAPYYYTIDIEIIGKSAHA